MRGAILGSRGASFVLQVRGFQVKEEPSVGGGERPDIALLPPHRPFLLEPQAPSPLH